MIAKLIRNTPMAKTTRQHFVSEMIKVFKANSPWFKETRFRDIALRGAEVEPVFKHFVENKENEIGIRYSHQCESCDNDRKAC